MRLSNGESYDSDNVVHIALASDENYFCGLLVTAVSLAECAEVSIELRYYILDGGLSERSWDLLVLKIKDVHPNADVKRIILDDSIFASFRTWGCYSSRMSYARFMLPAVITECKYVLYCDVDFLWNVDVSQMWLCRSDNYVVQGSKDISRNSDGDEVEELERMWFLKYGLRFSAKNYVCAGILVVNLEKMRLNNYVEKLMKFMHEHPNANYCDQTAINAVLYGQIGLLDGRWQVFSRELTAKVWEKGCAVHYAGDTPWAKFGLWCFGLTDVRMLWFKYYAKCRGVKMLEALMEFYPLRTIIFRRLMFLLPCTPLLKTVYYYVLRVTGRSSYINLLKWYHRL